MAADAEPLGMFSKAAIALAVAGFAVWLVGGWLPSIWRLERSRDWPHVPGVVEASQVKEVRDPDGPSGYTVRARVRYQVGARTFECTDWRLGREPEYRSREEAEAERRTMADARRVAVYYDPADPARSVLRPGATPNELRKAAFLMALLATVLSWVPYLLFVGFTPAPSRDALRVRERRESAAVMAATMIFLMAGLGLLGAGVFRVPYPSGFGGAGLLAAVVAALAIGAAVSTYRDPDPMLRSGSR